MFVLTVLIQCMHIDLDLKTTDYFWHFWKHDCLYCSDWDKNYFCFDEITEQRLSSGENLYFQQICLCSVSVKLSLSKIKSQYFDAWNTMQKNKYLQWFSGNAKTNNKFQILANLISIHTHRKRIVNTKLSSL